MAAHTLGPLAAIPENTNRAFTIGAHEILVCRAPAGLFAVANRCSHAAQDLQDGRMRGYWLFCPHHGARFDLRTGASAGQLTPHPIATYPVTTDEAGQLVVTLPE